MTAPKPHLVLRTIRGKPVEARTERESTLEAARRRFGRKFAHESGTAFEWKPGPTVLTNWLAKRIAAKDES